MVAIDPEGTSRTDIFGGQALAEQRALCLGAGERPANQVLSSGRWTESPLLCTGDEGFGVRNMFNHFSHVGIAVHDLDSAVMRWTSVFGLKVVDQFCVPNEGVTSVILSTGGAYGEATCVELVSPLNSKDISAPIARRLAEKGEGVFHLAFRVDNAERASSCLYDAGLRAVALEAAGPETESRVVIHPKSANGVLIELLSGPVPEQSGGIDFS